MLVSHAHQFIYLKTRKTAGTSVEMALQPAAAASPDALINEKIHARLTVRGVIGQRGMHEEELKPLDKVWYNHMPASAVCQLLGPRLWARYTKVAVVRNPFERMVSLFHWRETLRPLNLGRPARDPLSEDFAAVRDRFVALVASENWQTDEDVVMLDGHFCLDVALRHEYLARDLAEFARRVEFDPASVKLPETKVGRHLRQGRPVSDYFDPQSIAVVLRRMAWVFDRFDYAPTPSEEPT